MWVGRGLSRLTGAAAPRHRPWPDDEERAPEGSRVEERAPPEEAFGA
jgi:hypothetical protein